MVLRAGEDETPGSVIGKIGRETAPGKLGRWISSAIEDRNGKGEDVHLQVTSSVLYRALKAVITAGGNLEDKGALLAIPKWQRMESKKNNATFALADMTFRLMPATFSWDAEATTMSVGKDTPVNKLAGAIANELRSKGQVNVRGIGSEPVTKSLKAAIKSREYLQQQDDPQAIVGCSPVFEDLHINEGNTTSALKLRIVKL
mmetsp:Transcript_13544/g.30709  ORF Transcript_13544/g.30709 Transcript_13544/m.30709 type:complete len:202 (-) Transcript_13544:168-773(-)